MISADFAVQIKLIIMYTIGITTLIAIFFYLHHLTHRWFTKSSITLALIITIMAAILFTTIKLP